MASSKDRQRKLARAKIDRQNARRAEALRRRRQVRAGVGVGLAVLLLAVGGFWLFGGFEPEPEPAAAPETCVWTPQDPTANTNLKDVGVPATTSPPVSGTRTLTITTGQGTITADVDLATAPCAAASLAHLAEKGFYTDTACHELTAEGALRCGDPSGTGLGGPTYSFANETVPPAPDPSASPDPATPAYPKGTIAMIGAPPSVNGSQFLIFFKDFAPATPAYSIVGSVTGGLDVVEAIGRAGAVDNEAGEQVKPKNDVVIKSLTMTDPTAAPSPTPSGSAQS